MLKKIRINNNNSWYLVKYLSIIIDKFPITSSDLRTNLLDSLRSNPDYAELEKEKITKLNDSLFTYSFQFSSQFNLVNYLLEGFILPTNLSKLVLTADGQLKKLDDIVFRKIIMLTDKMSGYNILLSISKETDITLGRITQSLAIRLFDKNINNSNLFVEGIESFVKLSTESKLVNEDEKGILSINDFFLRETISSHVWVSIEEFNKNFKWADFISAYNYCVHKLGTKKISIQLIVSQLSLKYNTLVSSVIPIIKTTPSAFEEKKIYLIQGRISSSDSIEIAGALYNSVEIE